MKKLDKLNKNIQIRIPLIPGFNDNEEEITRISDFVSTFNSIVKIDLLPYHTLGVNKYSYLNKEYKTIIGSIKEKQIQKYKRLFTKKI